MIWPLQKDATLGRSGFHIILRLLLLRWCNEFSFSQTKGNRTKEADSVPARLLAAWLGWREGCSSRKAATITNRAYDPMPPWYTCTTQTHSETLLDAGWPMQSCTASRQGSCINQHCVLLWQVLLLPVYTYSMQNAKEEAVCRL